ncbi:helix-turn-helix domain-containing protein [Fibrella sp. WM1]|uniref:helix-turn-helix domain-containing protein n=1 Tax=Fibrella musci TaxID=3242485 RepID=UPI0035205D29
MTIHQDDIRQQVGEMIREARRSKGLTQKEVADVLNVSEGTYSRYESGQANLSLLTINKIVKAIGLNLKMSLS